MFYFFLQADPISYLTLQMQEDSPASSDLLLFMNVFPLHHNRT